MRIINIITATRDDGLEVEVGVCWSDWAFGVWWDKEDEHTFFTPEIGVYIGPFNIAFRRKPVVRTLPTYLIHTGEPVPPWEQWGYDITLMEDGTVIPHTTRGYEIKREMEEG